MSNGERAGRHNRDLWKPGPLSGAVHSADNKRIARRIARRKMKQELQAEIVTQGGEGGRWVNTLPPTTASVRGLAVVKT